MNFPEPSCKNRSRTTMKCRKSCCRKKVESQPNNTRQFQFGCNGIGDFCELGCCDFSEKYTRHSCPRPKTP